MQSHSKCVLYLGLMEDGVVDIIEGKTSSNRYCKRSSSTDIYLGKDFYIFNCLGTGP